MAEPTSNGDTGDESGLRAHGEVLDVRDVLPGIALEGAEADAHVAYLTVRTVGDNTVVSVDPDGAGPAVALPIATLEGITGVTLQQLLSSNQDIIS